MNEKITEEMVANILTEYMLIKLSLREHKDHRDYCSVDKMPLINLEGIDDGAMYKCVGGDLGVSIIIATDGGLYESPMFCGDDIVLDPDEEFSLYNLINGNDVEYPVPSKDGFSTEFEVEFNKIIRDTNVFDSIVIIPLVDKENERSMFAIAEPGKQKRLIGALELAVLFATSISEIFLVGKSKNPTAAKEAILGRAGKNTGLVLA